MDLQILPDNPGNDAHSHAMLFINPCYSEAHIILFARGAVVVAGVRHSIDTIGEADVDDTFMYVRHLAGIFALDAAFLQVVMAGVLGHTLDIRPDADFFYAFPIVTRQNKVPIYCSFTAD